MTSTASATTTGPAGTRDEVSNEDDPHPQQGRDPEARRFMNAIILGILIGIAAMGALIGVAIKIVAPDTETAAIVAVAVWVALFCGPFVAGTVTVGLSSKH